MSSETSSISKNFLLRGVNVVPNSIHAHGELRAILPVPVLISVCLVCDFATESRLYSGNCAENVKW